MQDSTTSPIEKRCSKCNTVKPAQMFYKNKNRKDGLNGHCKSCLKEWETQNIEHVRSKQTEWRHANGDRISAQKAASPRRKEYSREYYVANREAILEYGKRDDVKLRKRLREDENREALRARARLRKPDPIKKKAKDQRRRAQKSGSSGNVTAQQIIDLIHKQNGHCAYCGDPTEMLTMDHMHPLIKGGIHSIENIAMCCGICNSSKGGRTLEEWTNRWYQRRK